MIYQGNKTYQVDMAQNYAVSGGSGVTSIVRTEITVAGRAATIHEAATGDMYIYHISDHLGNTRVSFSVNTNHTISVESYTDYYASGWEMPGRTYTSANRTRFGYQGAFTENDADLGMTTFDLRAYDARLMRWHNPDPYDQFHSPYVAMGNDWVNGVDADGGFKTRFEAWVYKTLFFSDGEVIEATHGSRAGEWYVGKDGGNGTYTIRWGGNGTPLISNLQNRGDAELLNFLVQKNKNSWLGSSPIQRAASNAYYSGQPITTSSRKAWYESENPDNPFSYEEYCRMCIFGAVQTHAGNIGAGSNSAASVRPNGFVAPRYAGGPGKGVTSRFGQIRGGIQKAQDLTKGNHNLKLFDGKRIDLKGRHPLSKGHYNKVTKEQLGYPHVYDPAHPGGVRSPNANDYIEIFNLFK